MGEFEWSPEQLALLERGASVVVHWDGCESARELVADVDDHGVETLGGAIADLDQCDPSTLIPSAERMGAELATLRAENERLKGELAEATHSRDFTQQWYAERLQRLRDLARETGRERDHCAIVANGSLMGEPPTYAQQLNLAKYRADKAESDLREAQATIERVRELREAAHEAVSVFGREALSGNALGTLERLQSALASAKPEPSTDARPGWVAVGVLRELARRVSDADASSLEHVDTLRGFVAGFRDAIACELTTIADNAGDAEAVERAACATVQRMIEDRCVVSVERCDVDSLREGSDCPLYGSDEAVYVTKVHADNDDIVDGEVYSRDLYEAITQAPSFESAGKGGEGESDA